VLIRDSAEDLEDIQDNADFDLLDERLLSSQAIALEQCSRVIAGMAGKVRKNVGRSLNLIHEFSEKKYSKVQRKEDLIDKYESKVGAYLVTLTKSELNSRQTRELTADIRVIGNLERIGDYASSIAYTMKQMNEDNIHFSETGTKDLNAVIEAERDIVNSTIRSYLGSDLETAMEIKPFSAAISSLCEILRARHIGRLRRGECTMGQGAAFNDLLNCIERISSHCVEISGQIRRSYQTNPDYHVHSLKAAELSEEEYQKLYDGFLTKYDMISNTDRPLSMEDEAVT
jgi:phosphate:Na+ symporter